MKSSLCIAAAIFLVALIALDAILINGLREALEHYLALDIDKPQGSLIQSKQLQFESWLNILMHLSLMMISIALTVYVVIHFKKRCFGKRRDKYTKTTWYKNIAS